MKENRLVTIVFSHYNEKARWALDWTGTDYVEEAWMPFFSHFAVIAATRGKGGRSDSASSRFSTPILVTKDGQRICDSTDIARWASAKLPGDPLFPTPGVIDLVERFGKTIGPSTRLVAYWHLLKSKTALRTITERNVGPVQSTAFRALAPFAKQAIQRTLGVDDRRKARAIEKVKGELVFVEELLSKHRYLAGDHFTAADLTFASLFVPATLPTREEGFAAALCDQSELSEEARDLVAEMRATRAGKFALEMFAKHRHETFKA
jgi:glutathione S-transferase